MRKVSLLASAALLAACSGGANAPSSDAYTKGPPEGSTAVRADPKAPIVLSSGTDVRTALARLTELGFHVPARSDITRDSAAQTVAEPVQRAAGMQPGPLDRATLEAMGLTVVPLTRTGPVASTSGLAGLPGEAEAPPDQVRVGAVIDSGRAPIARPGASGGPGGRALSPRTLSPAAVSEVQRRLLDRGLYRGEVDGIWGPLSNRALIEFQTANGLPAHGQIDAETAGRLGLDLQRFGPGASGGTTGGALPPYTSPRR